MGYGYPSCYNLQNSTLARSDRVRGIIWNFTLPKHFKLCKQIWRRLFWKTKDFIFQTIILANEAGGHGELGEDGQEGLVRKLLQLGDQTRAEEGPRSGTPGGLKHMAVVDIGSSQQFEVVRIIFRTYSYPELSEIAERFLDFIWKS